MALKAAYFSLTMGEDDQIDWNPHLRNAINHGRTTHTITWRGGGVHDVPGWAELLVAERTTIAGMAYPVDVGQEVQAHGQRIGLLWSETSRYHKNVAYRYEVTQVRLSTEWLLVNLELL